MLSLKGRVGLKKNVLHWVIGNLFHDITCDNHPESNTSLCKVKAIVPQTARMAYIRSITWLSVVPCFHYTSSIFLCLGGPAGSHGATVSHVMSAHLEVIEADSLHVLDSFPFTGEKTIEWLPKCRRREVFNG